MFKRNLYRSLHISNARFEWSIIAKRFAKLLVGLWLMIVSCVQLAFAGTYEGKIVWLEFSGSTSAAINATLDMNEDMLAVQFLVAPSGSPDTRKRGSMFVNSPVKLAMASALLNSYFSGEEVSVVGTLVSGCSGGSSMVGVDSIKILPDS